MSRLESRAKPVIESLLDDDIVHLLPKAQAIAALWAIKTAMVFETLRAGRTWFYEAQEREMVRNDAIPTGHTAVWIAKCVNLPGFYCSASDLSESVEQRASEARGYVTTMAFGSLEFQVLTIRPPTSIPLGTLITTDLRPGPWSEATLQIWPPRQDSRWPPPVGLDGEGGIEALRKRFRPIEEFDDGAT